MGSSCSILNDTEHDVWITHGVNWKVLIASVGGVAAFVTGGVALAALGATVGVGGALLWGGAVIMAEEGIIVGTTALTIAGLTAGQWTLVGVVTTASATALATALNISKEEAEKLQKQVKDFQNNAELIKPGGKYTWSGTLSLTKTVYVMNDKLQFDQRGCFTGPTDGSENVYPISQYFQQLDVKKKPEDSIPVDGKRSNEPWKNI